MIYGKQHMNIVNIHRKINMEIIRRNDSMGEKDLFKVENLSKWQVFSTRLKTEWQVDWQY